MVYQAMEHGYDTSGTKRRIVEAIGRAAVPPTVGSVAPYMCIPKSLSNNSAGYWWVAGWIAECAWQYFFQWQTKPGMWICMFCLLAGFSSFIVALANLYRQVACYFDALQ